MLEHSKRRGGIALGNAVVALPRPARDQALGHDEKPGQRGGRLRWRQLLADVNARPDEASRSVASRLPPPSSRILKEGIPTPLKKQEKCGVRLTLYKESRVAKGDDM